LYLRFGARDSSSPYPWTSTPRCVGSRAESPPTRAQTRARTAFFVDPCVSRTSRPPLRRELEEAAPSRTVWDHDQEAIGSMPQPSCARSLVRSTPRARPKTNENGDMSFSAKHTTRLIRSPTAKFQSGQAVVYDASKLDVYSRRRTSMALAAFVYADTARSKAASGSASDVRNVRTSWAQTTRSNPPHWGAYKHRHLLLSSNR
jgi:hypothetical protein